ncbi:T-complex protein 1 subunit epsilon-like [Planococcus citri]|uniref:T-complex protein 1 subunit epsilon-like n=1 Tax=Planococcus citri TaxID=170843 RepID=UPI0031F7EBB0
MNRNMRPDRKEKYASHMTFDEYGRPFIILREQSEKEQISGVDVIKGHILAAKAVTSIMKSSLGPKSLDKAMLSPDGDLTVTNDGVTILQQMDVDHAIAKLLVELSECQDNGVGDGTTGVVVLAGALLEEVDKLIEKGIHPIRIADGFELAAQFCMKHLDSISEQISVENNNDFLKRIAMTSLRSKIVSKCTEKFAEMAVEAVLKVADIENNFVDLERIKMEGKTGGSLEDTILVNGVVLDQQFSHSHMEKELTKAAIAIVGCGLEMPKPNQVKAYLEMASIDTFKEVKEYEQEIYNLMVNKLVEVGANCVVCQAGIEDTANYLLLRTNTIGLRYVSEREIELMRSATGAKVVARFEDLTYEKLGFAGSVRELSIGTDNNRLVLFEDCLNSSVVTILIRGGNSLVSQAKRSFHDALCMIKNLILENKIVYGGGSCELSCAIAVSKEADKISTLEQYSFRAFADALESIPITLAENCGYSPIHLVTETKSRQILEENPFLGIDCMQEGTSDMKKQQVIETLRSKKQQILLAMQVVKQILKIDEVRATDKNYEIVVIKIRAQHSVILLELCNNILTL